MALTAGSELGKFLFIVINLKINTCIIYNIVVPDVTLIAIYTEVHIYMNNVCRWALL